MKTVEDFKKEDTKHCKINHARAMHNDYWVLFNLQIIF